jgi:hypothetical protein
MPASVISLIAVLDPAVKHLMGVLEREDAAWKTRSDNGTSMAYDDLLRVLDLYRDSGSPDANSFFAKYFTQSCTAKVMQTLR